MICSSPSGNRWFVPITRNDEALRPRVAEGLSQAENMRTRHSRNASRFVGRVGCLLIFLAASRIAFAQDHDLSAGWSPIGAAPVDQAGAGRRGYVLSPEDSDITAAGTTRISIHAVAANNFYREQNREFLVSERFETHTIAVDFRRGFTIAGAPRFEIGGQLQLHESDSGMLNGFIVGVESFWARVTGYQESRNELRGAGATAPPLGTTIARNGMPVYRRDGGGSGFGDVSLVAKAALIDAAPSASRPRVSARLGVNLAGGAPFSEGNYLGAGLSLDQKLSESVALHGDVRATRALDATSVWNLPLRRWTFGFSAGPEFRLPKRSSLNLQIDGNSTPYLPTGTLAFDKGYGAITFGLGHRFGSVTAQLYVRENMNLPFTVRWNTDPDLSLGLKLRIH
jgi:hypothetical protein